MCPILFTQNHAPASEDLFRLVDAALAAKRAGSPVAPDLKSAYQSLLRALLHCSTQTRPDVAYSVGMLCRAMSCPIPELLAAARRVPCYLSHHRAVGLRHSLADQNPLTGFSDPD
eukprot:2725957-Pleurochrysis_carterae.AAC.2